MIFPTIHTMEYWTYILYSETLKISFILGKQTLDTRIERHNLTLVKNKNGIPWKLIPLQNKVLGQKQLKETKLKRSR